MVDTDGEHIAKGENQILSNIYGKMTIISLFLSQEPSVAAWIIEIQNLWPISSLIKVKSTGSNEVISSGFLGTIENWYSDVVVDDDKFVNLFYMIRWDGRWYDKMRNDQSSTNLN